MALSGTEINENINLTCQYCFKSIDDNEEKHFCKACGLPYHSICWERGNGCTVLSCSQRNVLLNPLFQSSVPVRELLIHIEYLLNIKKYNEALNECSRILNVEKNNVEAKVYYNRTISALNIKMKIYESAETSMSKKEYTASAMFLKEYLKYCDEEESEYINSRIVYLNELLPTINRKKVLIRSIYSLIVLIILLTSGFLVYRFVYLKEVIEFAEIEKQDDYSGIKTMEMQVSRYEKFAEKYPEGNLRGSAYEKIFKFSAEIAEKLCEADWRTSLLYLKKIDSKQSPITYKDIYGKIKSSAEKELKEFRAEARENDLRKKYTEARDRIEKSLALIDNFPETEYSKVRQELYETRNLLNRKSGLIVKSKEIDKEIVEKTAELKTSEPEINFDKLIHISGKIMKRSGEFSIIRSFEDKKLYAIQNAGTKYLTGEEVTISGIKKGTAEINDDASNMMILPIIIDISNKTGDGGDKREDLIQRLQYLKGQKERIDSVLSLRIM